MVYAAAMNTVPTGREPFTPVRLKKISVTERAYFRKCRRRWFLADVHRLQGPGSAMYYLFGTAMHTALETYHTLEGFWKEQATLDAFGKAWDAAEAKARGELGFLWLSVEPDWIAHRDLGQQMLKGYFTANAKAGFDYPDLGRALEVEKRFTVRIPGTNGKLTGKLDLISVHGEETWGVDHKNLASTHSSAQLDLDDQLTGYAWLYYQATGDRLDAVVYNVLLKKLPLTKSGKPTESVLFVRDVTTRSEAQLIQFEMYLREEWKDARAVALHPERAYPNPSQFNCSGCPVRSICVSMMNEEDVEDTILAGYRIGEERE
jgi:hypothetical protein